jgi:hypothetical protein
MSSEKLGNEGQYHFVLYIDSEKPKSVYVAERLRTLCQHCLNDPYILEVFDLHKNQYLFEEQRIIAAPTLDVTTPRFRKHRFVGDLSQSEMFIISLGMRQTAEKMGQEAIIMGEEATRELNKIKNPGDKNDELSANQEEENGES